MLKLKGKSNKNVWVCIEGVDAVGKTLMVKNLKQVISKHKQKKFKVVFLKEFSDSKIGDLIRDVIKKDNFFTLGNKNIKFPFSETLLLCADYIHQLEKLLKYKNERLLIISDRGPLTFFTYQVLRIKDSYGNSVKMDAVDWIKEIFKPIEFPVITILLTLPITQIKKRITNRDGHIPEDNLLFIEKIQKEYLKSIKNYPQSSYMIFENTDANIKVNEKKIMEKIVELIN